MESVETTLLREGDEWKASGRRFYKGRRMESVETTLLREGDEWKASGRRFYEAGCEAA